MSRVRIERGAFITYVLFLAMAIVLMLAGAVGCRQKSWKETRSQELKQSFNPSTERQRQEACAFIKQFPDACDEQ